MLGAVAEVDLRGRGLRREIVPTSGRVLYYSNRKNRRPQDRHCPTKPPAKKFAQNYKDDRKNQPQIRLQHLPGPPIVEAEEPAPPTRTALYARLPVSPVRWGVRTLRGLGDGLRSVWLVSRGF